MEENDIYDMGYTGQQVDEAIGRALTGEMLPAVSGTDNGKTMIVVGGEWQMRDMPPLAEHGVFFIDYDGTLVCNWSAADVSAKTALPANPSHTGLVAQGWNWDLASIKSYIAAYPEADVYVGQTYGTASGLTEFDITVTPVTGKTVTCKMTGNKNWGDGARNRENSHTYADYGDYTITCDGTSIPSGTSSSGGVFGQTSSNANRYWCTAVRIGGSVTSIGAYAFNYCISLQSVTMPGTLQSFGNYAFAYCYSLQAVTIPTLTSAKRIESYQFYYCYALRSVSIPDGVTSVSSYAFGSCHILQGVTIPATVTTINNYAFSNCYTISSITVPNSVTGMSSNDFYYCNCLRSVKLSSGLTSIPSNLLYACYDLTGITIPAGVTSIGASAFSDCFGITEYDFSAATAVPTLSNTNAFRNINGLCKIKVPSALLTQWKAAANWSTYADYIVAA